ncbi:hypothetical protein L6R49_13670 [Myxococcota bacterium]|nr:hypothetical protein [Myxococcota bacterium]
MANFRPKNDAERSLILQLAQAYFSSADVDPQVKKVYDRSFAPLATEYEESIAAHRTCQSEVNTEHDRVVTSDALVDETQRLITLDVEARHGKAGLKELERLCGGRTRSEVTGLNVGEELTVISEMFVRVDAGSTITIDAALLTTQRAQVADGLIYWASYQRALSSQRAARARLDAARLAFDAGWTRFVASAKSLLSDAELARLVPDFSVMRAR